MKNENKKQMQEPKVFDSYIKILNFTFKEGNKWYVNEGTGSFYALVEDKDFLDRVDRKIQRFSKVIYWKLELESFNFIILIKTKLKVNFILKKF